MPHITTAMNRSLRRGLGDIVFDSLLGRRDVEGEVSSVKNSFSSWSNCMQATYCKWPVIIAIIVVSLVLFSVLWCIIRCACCGMSCCCSCFSFLQCCDCCGGCCDGKKNKPHKHMDDPYSHGPSLQPAYQGYQAPAPMMGGALGPPQYAQFEVGKNGLAVEPKPAALSEDALPPMPSWETAAKKHVLADEQEKDNIELGELDPATGQRVPLMTGAAHAGSSVPGSPLPEMGGGSPYGARPGQGIGGAGYMGIPNDPHTLQNEGAYNRDGRGYRGSPSPSPGLGMGGPGGRYGSPSPQGQGPNGRGNGYGPLSPQGLNHQGSRYGPPSPQELNPQGSGSRYGPPSQGLNSQGSGYGPSSPQELNPQGSRYGPPSQGLNSQGNGYGPPSPQELAPQGSGGGYGAHSPQDYSGNGNGPVGPAAAYGRNPPRRQYSNDNNGRPFPAQMPSRAYPPDSSRPSNSGRPYPDSNYPSDNFRPEGARRGSGPGRTGTPPVNNNSGFNFSGGAQPYPSRGTPPPQQMPYAAPLGGGARSNSPRQQGGRNGGGGYAGSTAPPSYASRSPPPQEASYPGYSPYAPASGNQGGNQGGNSGGRRVPTALSPGGSRGREPQGWDPVHS